MINTVGLRRHVFQPGEDVAKRFAEPLRPASRPPGCVSR